jgi:hypothetical protein
MEREQNTIKDSTITAGHNVHVGNIINRYDTRPSVLNLVIFAMTISDVDQLHGQKIKNCHDKQLAEDVTNDDHYDSAFHHSKENDFCAQRVRHHYGAYPSEWKPFCYHSNETPNLNIDGLVNRIFYNRNIDINIIYIYNVQEYRNLKQAIQHNKFMPNKALLIFDSLTLLHKEYQTLFKKIYDTSFGGVIALTYCNLPNDAQNYLRVVVRDLASRWHDGRKAPDQPYYLHLGDEYLFENLLLTATIALKYNVDLVFNAEIPKSKKISKSSNRL